MPQHPDLDFAKAELQTLKAAGTKKMTVLVVGSLLILAMACFYDEVLWAPPTNDGGLTPAEYGNLESLANWRRMEVWRNAMWAEALLFLGTGLWVALVDMSRRMHSTMPAPPGAGG